MLDIETSGLKFQRLGSQDSGRYPGSVLEMKLADMKRGDVATIVNVSGEGQLRKRILDLGFTSGVKVKMLRIAPLGDPIEVELRGYRLTVRKTEADIVELDNVVRAETGAAQ